MDADAQYSRMGIPVIWRIARGGYDWHATEDGVHALCNKALLVGERQVVPVDDPSNDSRTCGRCKYLVGPAQAMT